MSRLTTHVLDVSRGRPAQGVTIRLELGSGAAWRELGRGETDADGRCRTLLPDGQALQRGVYRLCFETGEYFRAQGQPSFYPSVEVRFEVVEPGEHHHVPLLLSPFGYTTYRGS
jgi:5-hydroxyisourate hydrolase